MRSSTIPVFGTAVSVALLSCAAPASAAFHISRFTIDGGGGSSAGGTFALTGTIGQPDAGLLVGSSFAISGGFWFGGGGVVTAVAGDGPGDGSNLTTAAPLAFRMYPARPNPVAARTVVAFDLPEQARVRAALYDVTGRLVRVLVEETLPGGRHQRPWDGRNQSGRPVPSGIYFLRLDAGTHHSHQKIVVVS
jgi:hypothetical protein